MPDERDHRSHWHEGWLAVSLLFILLVTALSYPVMLAHGFGYELSMAMALLLFILLVAVVVVLFAGLKTDQELRKRGIYDKARKSGRSIRTRLKEAHASRKTRKAQAKGGNKEG